MNVVFILSDQHAAAFTGCYGGRTRTPNIDSLAARGTRFTGAYCASPICAPGRACLFTGRYAHETGVWDNTTGYDGRVGSWPAHLSRCNVPFTSIGRLDFKEGAPLGIDDVRLPSFRGSPDVVGLYRQQPPVERRAFYYEYYDIAPKPPGRKFPVDAGDDEPDDRDITAAAVDWLQNERPVSRPWVLYVGYCNPHPKWHPDPKLFNNYLRDMPALAPKYRQPLDDLHPADQRNSITTCAYANENEAAIQRMHAAYHAVVEEFDAEVGRIIQAIDAQGQLDDTLVIYCSDHGESARAHGNLAKSSMYEDAVGVPLIVCGPGVASGRVEHTPVCHFDLFPTIAEATGAVSPHSSCGYSLWPLLRQDGSIFARPFVFAEYHANHAMNAQFMVRQDRWKFVEHLYEAPSLFDLRSDPDEMNDLVMHDGQSSQVRSRVEELRCLLHSVCDPKQIDTRAKQDQAQLRQRLSNDGELEEAVYLRGYERNTERLIPWDWEVFERLYHPM